MIDFSSGLECFPQSLKLWSAYFENEKICFQCFCNLFLKEKAHEREYISRCDILSSDVFFQGNLVTLLNETVTRDFGPLGFPWIDPLINFLKSFWTHLDILKFETHSARCMVSLRRISIFPSWGGFLAWMAWSFLVYFKHVQFFASF
jgi:hypothetical protein